MAIKIQNGVVIDDNKNFIVGAGDTASRPAVTTENVLRFNSDNTRFEVYDGSNWENLPYFREIPEIQDSSTWSSTNATFPDTDDREFVDIHVSGSSTYILSKNGAGGQTLKLYKLDVFGNVNSTAVTLPDFDDSGDEPKIITTASILGVEYLIVGYENINITSYVLAFVDISNSQMVLATVSSVPATTAGGGNSVSCIVENNRIHLFSDQFRVAEVSDLANLNFVLQNNVTINAANGCASAKLHGGRVYAALGDNFGSETVVSYELDSNATTLDQYYINETTLFDTGAAIPYSTPANDVFITTVTGSSDLHLIIDTGTSFDQFNISTGIDSASDKNTTNTGENSIVEYAQSPAGTSTILYALGDTNVISYALQLNAPALQNWTYSYTDGAGIDVSTDGSAYLITGTSSQFNKIKSDGTDTPSQSPNLAEFIDQYFSSGAAELGENTVTARELDVSTNGTSGQVLASDGDGSFSWVNAGGATLTDDTTTSTTQYVTMSRSTSGSQETAFVSSTKLFFDPSTGELSATNFNSLSDASLKENVQTITNGLDVVNQINPVSFTWKDSGKASNGVIAQELEQILPEVVSTGPDGTKSVSYDQLIAFLIDAVQKLDERTK